MISIPRTATAPFCPSEVMGSVLLDANATGLGGFWRNMRRAAGPGLLVAVGYMDPGNWATDIAAGSQFGYALLFVVLFSSLSAMLLQCLCARLGIATGQDLAQLCAARYGKPSRIFLWLMAEVSIIACDLAEVLGGALAFHLLLGIPLMGGLALTLLDTVIVLGLKGRNFRTLEAIILALVATIGACFLVEVIWAGPAWQDVAAGFVPSFSTLRDVDALQLAIGIVGATVMPHNLYLHSSIINTRRVGNSDAARQQGARLATIDTVVALSFAFFINAAILILAGAAFGGDHGNGGGGVDDIAVAYKMLTPVLGAGAAFLFGFALLASGQSSTFTGTIAGQVIMEGFINLKIPCWKRRLITRSLALLPAFIGVGILGDGGVGRMLVLSQIVLGVQLPFALYPLLKMCGDRVLMGALVLGPIWRFVAWVIFAIITAGNFWMLYGLL